MIKKTLRGILTLTRVNKKGFGILSEYNARLNKKLTNTHQLDDKP